MNNYLKYIILLIILLIIFIGWANNRYQTKLGKLPHVNFKSVEKDLKTGDLLLCSGSINQITADNLKYYSIPICCLLSLNKACYYTIFNTIWSHAGVIIKKDNKAYVYEITSNDMPMFDTLTQTCKRKGTRLVLLEDKLKSYSGEMGIQRLNKPINIPFKLPKSQFKIGNLFNIIFKTKKKDTPYNPTYQMCSEIIFNFFKSVGILDSTLSPEVILPCDFDSKWVQYQDEYKHLEPFIIK